MRLRGSGGESQEELDALETLSGSSCATFKRVMRKLHHVEFATREIPRVGNAHFARAIRASVCIGLV